MKAVKLNKIFGVAAILFISVFAVFMLQFSNIEKSYADKDPATKQQEVATFEPELPWKECSVTDSKGTEYYYPVWTDSAPLPDGLHIGAGKTIYDVEEFKTMKDLGWALQIDLGKHAYYAWEEGKTGTFCAIRANNFESYNKAVGSNTGREFHQYKGDCAKEGDYWCGLQIAWHQNIYINDCTNTGVNINDAWHAYRERCFCTMIVWTNLVDWDDRYPEYDGNANILLIDAPGACKGDIPRTWDAGIVFSHAFTNSEPTYKVEANVDLEDHGSIIGDSFRYIPVGTPYTVDNINKRIIIGNGVILYNDKGDYILDKWMIGDQEAPESGIITNFTTFTAKTKSTILSISGKVIHNTQNLPGIINVDLQNIYGEVIAHQEFIPSHTCDYCLFNFGNIRMGSEVQIHVYTEYLGDVYWSDQLSVLDNIQLDPIFAIPRICNSGVQQ